LVLGELVEAKSKRRSFPDLLKTPITKPIASPHGWLAIAAARKQANYLKLLDPSLTDKL
jgi:hypothetical protein